MHPDLAVRQVGKGWPACDHVPYGAAQCRDVHRRREWRGVATDIYTVLLWSPVEQKSSRSSAAIRRLSCHITCMAYKPIGVQLNTCRRDTACNTVA
jgi:hypothetical protein